MTAFDWLKLWLAFNFVIAVWRVSIAYQRGWRWENSFGIIVGKSAKGN